MSLVLASITYRAVAAAGILLDEPDPGIFKPILDNITSLARDLWGVAVGLIIIAATLAMIISVLRGTGGMMIGGSKETTVAVISIVGVVLLVVIAFVAIPQLTALMQGLQTTAPF